MTNTLGILDSNHKVLVPTDVIQIHAIARQIGNSMSYNSYIDIEKNGNCANQQIVYKLKSYRLTSYLRG